MSLQDAIQKGVDATTTPEMLALRFRHQLTFRLGPHTWDVRCSVRDPQRIDPKALARMGQLTNAQGIATSDLRLLTVHPDDTVPVPGATAAWDDGTLEILEWSQPSDFTGQRLGTCALRRP
ncbi:hypothetical protein [Deinococcus soli (ex Cha et al. 2016)]|uniref:Uncharacterized protein n=1 Tax=Deinococcus soli (ex Cha et al. 2016) TaxID=1309411 RepID=A0A0F7JM36_9DEIO|nr:hypothetical protein [Deinococcus soli (ex Cha et al. 2016)]AKH15958.1 hypothetical protein SY84_01615 [Deinococcus soli (ex Cha et al. 2016)]